MSEQKTPSRRRFVKSVAGCDFGSPVQRVGAIVLTVGVGWMVLVFAQYDGWLIPEGGKTE